MCVHDMPAEVLECIAEHLPRNEVTLGLRPVGRAVVLSGKQYQTVRLSQTVPSNEFVLHWSVPGASRNLSLQRRSKPLCLVASSGSIANLEAAVELAGCLPSTDVLCAAAAAGQVNVCRWRLEHDCTIADGQDGVLVKAVRAGQQAACEWLLANGCTWNAHVAYATATGGHVGLMDWLLAQRREGDPLVAAEGLLTEAARGCDRPTLQRLHRDWSSQLPGGWAGGGGGGAQPGLAAAAAVEDNGANDVEAIEALSGGSERHWATAHILATAVGSRTPDRQQKVEWLERLGYPRDNFAGAAKVPGARERFAWLRQRGHSLCSLAVGAAACAGDMAALLYLLDEAGVPCDMSATLLSSGAAYQGHLQVLQAPRQRGCVLNERCPAAAIEGGHLGVLAGRGAGAGPDTFVTAAGAGCEAALEWLVERGCPMEDAGDAYVWAAFKNDLRTLRVLRRLGRPWGPPGAVFARCLTHRGCRLPVLTWLAEAEAGCPVDWGAEELAEAAAARQGPQADEDIRAWWAEKRSGEVV